MLSRPLFRAPLLGSLYTCNREKREGGRRKEGGEEGDGKEKGEKEGDEWDEIREKRVR
jgi:hypothetical protein